MTYYNSKYTTLDYIKMGKTLWQAYPLPFQSKLCYLNLRETYLEKVFSLEYRQDTLLDTVQSDID